MSKILELLTGKKKLVSAGELLSEEQTVWNKAKKAEMQSMAAMKQITLASLTLAALSFLFGYSSLSKPKYQPYVIEVQSDGSAEFKGKVQFHKVDLNDAMITNALSNFIKKMRTVSTDYSVIVRNIEETYGFVTVKGSSMLTGYYRASDPIKTHESGVRREIVISSFSPLSASQWLCKWTEVYYKDGAVFDRKSLDGTFAFIQENPKTDAQIIANPLGIFFDEIYITGLSAGGEK
jgi:type IV secretory pathway TrbF-like protein